jgi:WD40 repeat protein
LAVGHGTSDDSVVDIVEYQAGQWRITWSRAVQLPALVTAVWFLDGGRQLLVAGQNGSLSLLDLDRRQVVWHKQTQSRKAFCMSGSRDGRMVATGADRQIRLWDTHSGELLAMLEVHMWVNSLTFSSDGQTLIWGGGDGSVNFEFSLPQLRQKKL